MFCAIRNIQQFLLSLPQLFFNVTPHQQFQRQKTMDIITFKHFSSIISWQSTDACQNVVIYEGANVIPRNTTTLVALFLLRGIRVIFSLFSADKEQN